MNEHQWRQREGLGKRLFHAAVRAVALPRQSGGKCDPCPRAARPVRRVLALAALSFEVAASRQRRPRASTSTLSLGAALGPRTEKRIPTPMLTGMTASVGTQPSRHSATLRNAKARMIGESKVKTTVKRIPSCGHPNATSRSGSRCRSPGSRAGRARRRRHRRPQGGAPAPSRPSLSGAKQRHKPSARTTISSPVRFDPIWL